MKFKKNIYATWINLINHQVNGKILLFESDDWGSTRVPSRTTYNRLLKSHNLGNCPYSRYDTLESDVDCELLIEMLLEFKDIYGNSPVFTMNFLSANPDYGKIKESNFSQYFYEDIEMTYESYSYDSMAVIHEGIKESVFVPAYHGREHLNPVLWLDLLKRNSKIRSAAENGLYFLSFANLSTLTQPYLASFYPYEKDFYSRHGEVFDKGVEMFINRFGKSPSSFVPPVYVWNEVLEKKVKASGIKAIQSLRKREKYLDINNKVSISFDKRKDSSPVSLLRNCHFEPSINHESDWVDSTMNEISIAFKLNRPAIISTHRLNYVGSISQDNRDNNLKLLRELLRRVLLKWTDVEFLNTDQILERIKDY